VQSLMCLSAAICAGAPVLDGPLLAGVVSVEGASVDQGRAQGHGACRRQEDPTTSTFAAPVLPHKLDDSRLCEEEKQRQGWITPKQGQEPLISCLVAQGHE